MPEPPAAMLDFVQPAGPADLPAANVSEMAEVDIGDLAGPNEVAGPSASGQGSADQDENDSEIELRINEPLEVDEQGEFYQFLSANISRTKKNIFLQNFLKLMPWIYW